MPTRVYFSGPNAKVEIALARGKDLHDKRRDIKARDQRICNLCQHYITSRLNF